MNLYLVPDRAGDDTAQLYAASRAAAEMRRDGLEPCDECGEWQSPDGSRKRPPMRLVAKNRYQCERCFQAALEQASESTPAAVLLTAEGSGVRRASFPRGPVASLGGAE